jgi:hypothetical protein
MLTKSTIALSLAIALGTASVAMAAPRHSIHHHAMVVERQVPAASYQTFGYTGSKMSEPDYIRIQDQDFKNQLGG